MKLLEKGLHSLLDQQKKTQGLQLLFRNLIRAVLYCISLCFKGVVLCRSLYYDRRIISKKFSMPIISIGNIVAGGTGKTPITCLLAELLQIKGKVAIVSRGYRSKAEKAKEPLVVLHGVLDMTPKECGDEPWLLAQKLKEALIIVGRKREKGVQKALDLGAEVVLLDDGMQKRSLYRDYNLAVVNGHSPFGGGFFLPRGYLREMPEALCRADIVIVNGIGKDSREQKDRVKEELRQFTKAPIVWGNVVYNELKFLKGKLSEKIENQPLNLLKNRKIALFCGIGHPERFLEGVKSLGCQVVKTLFLADHEEISAAMIEKLSSSSQKLGAEVIICTEKDAVKISPEAIKRVDLPLAFLPIHFNVQSDQNEWQEFIDKIYQQMNIGNRPYTKGKY